MFKQMIGDAKPQVFLTTGTAGGFIAACILAM
jgi:hypothetical protein